MTIRDTARHIGPPGIALDDLTRMSREMERRFISNV
jgi:hypothetical protein